MKNLVAKVKDQWSAILVIIAIFTLGMNYATTMTKLNDQIVSLTKTVSELSESVKGIANITNRVEILEDKLSIMEKEHYQQLLVNARLVLITLSQPSELDSLPASKAILKEACNSVTIRAELYEDLGTDRVIQFCSYVNR